MRNWVEGAENYLSSFVEFVPFRYVVRKIHKHKPVKNILLFPSTHATGFDRIGHMQVLNTRCLQLEIKFKYTEFGRSHKV
jgi:hypothetical protein